MMIGIGVQQILPRTGIGGQGTSPPPPDRNNDADREAAPAKPDRAPAAPGTGRVVDRII
jgi:hypothetical protein